MRIFRFFGKAEDIFDLTKILAPGFRAVDVSISTPSSSLRKLFSRGKQLEKLIPSRSGFPVECGFVGLFLNSGRVLYSNKFKLHLRLRRFSGFLQEQTIATLQSSLILAMRISRFYVTYTFVERQCKINFTSFLRLANSRNRRCRSAGVSG